MHRALICTLVCTAFACARVSAQATDVIRGQVTGADSKPLQGAFVKAVSYYGNITRTATTDRNGRYTIIFINGEGDYWLEFSKLTYESRRIEVRKIGNEEVMIADAKLSPTGPTIDTLFINIARKRELVNRNAAGADVGGGERPLTSAGLPPDQAASLAQMAGAVAGIQVIPGLDGAPDMFSLLGLGGEQNNTAFNGLFSGISALPPDFLVTTSIVPYTFDPAIGGFSGAQIAVRTVPGSNFSRRAVTSVGIAPPLEWADQTASAQGEKFTSMRLGGNGLGALRADRIFYNGAYNFSRRFSDIQTLLNTSPAGLTAAGVAPDSVRRLVAILDARQVPVGLGDVPGVVAQNAAQVAGNLDISPSASGTGNAFTVGVAGNYQSTGPVSRGSLLLATPAHAARTSFWGGSGVVTHSNYFASSILSKTTIGIGLSGSASDPYQEIPEGSVRVSSVLANGSSSVKLLSFGGNALRTSSSTRALQLSNQLSWYSLDNRHTLKLTTSVMHDAFTSELTSGTLGTFAFSSLADLEAGRPSSFTRTLLQSAREGRQLVAAASLGDYWRPTPALQVQYGMRVDANHFMTAPAFNQELHAALGVRNDKAPARAYVSPRLGVQWYYGASPQVRYAPGAARPPRAVIHAGIGVFQNMTGAQLISGAVGETGLASSMQTLSCAGAAAPVPDWTMFMTNPGSIPSHCTDGTIGTPFATSTPGVTLFDASYRQPRSLRAAVDWSSALLDNRFVLGIQGVTSRGSHQPGVTDLNFNPVVRFNVTAEENRPVFAEPNAVDPASGVIGAGTSRMSPSFRHVWSHVSELAVNARQLSVNLKPVTADARMKWDLTYTLLDVREQINGFTSTAGNPLTREWVNSGGRHAVTLRWSDFPVFDVVYVTAGIRVSSGSFYTPMVAGDVNGDGSFNDRAFIFDPSSMTDPNARDAMRSLLANGAPSARECLQQQMNRIAARNSCRTPWTALAGLQLKLNPVKVGLPKRVTAGLQMQNPLGLADLAVHGNGGIHGWGQNIAPDQNLLYVRGFDANTKQFRYEVNQRFGSTRPQHASAHTLPYLSLNVEVDIGAPRERQLLTQKLEMGRNSAGAPQSAESLKLLGTSAIPNPMAMILSQADSLKLDRRQADSIAFLSHRFAVFADSVWTPVGKHLAAMPASYDRGEAYARYVSAREQTVDFLLLLVKDARGVLTPSQRRKLPSQISSFLDPRVLKFLRSSSAGNGASVTAR